MTYRETPFFFDCEGASLLGVLTAPPEPSRLGVVIIVGGPQYRVGSHRQFVLLARALADAGIACLRFDYRGMGDSEGPVVEFDALGPDIRSAVAFFCRQQPTVEVVVLWGLCNGASASAMFADVDPRIAGVALFNPWVRTPAGKAEATMRHYYASRLYDARFWRKLLGGEVDVIGSLSALLRSVRTVLADRARSAAPSYESTLPDRVSTALARHRCPALVALSGKDEVAAEFHLAASRPGALYDQMRLSNRRYVRLEEADHTFSSARSMEQATAVTIKWLRSQFPHLLVAAAPTRPERI